MKKNPANREICRVFIYLYEQRGWEKFHDDQTKGYMFGCDNFYICTISDNTYLTQALCASFHIIVIFLEYCLF